jgi:trimethylamine--corrinoid protein Co-methyltransferase
MIKAVPHDPRKMRFLSAEDMNKIHTQALLLLKDTGVEVDDLKAIQLLEAAGAVVDQKTKVVRIPADLVEKSLKTVPREITLAGRSPGRDIVLKPAGEMHTRNTGGMVYIRDLRSKEVRHATLKDVAEFTALMDGLEHIDFVAPLFADDVPPIHRELYTIETMLRHTDKHISVRALTKHNLRYLMKMGEAVAGGKAELRQRPLFSFLESPIAPLRFPDVFIEALLLCGEYGVPFVICSVPNVGATGPITLEGSLLLATVESLAAITLSQVAHPGAPLIWAPRFPLMDMSTGHTGLMADGVILSAAAAQLAVEQYDLVCDLYGPTTNAIIPDGESIFDESLCAYVTAFAGRPSVLCGAGALELGLVACFEEMVMTNELFGVLKRILKGLEINDSRLGADAISRVGIGGNYLTDPHTLTFMRGERYESPFIKPRSRRDWVADGSKGFFDRAREKAFSILENHCPRQLDVKPRKDIREIIAAAEKDSNRL